MANPLDGEKILNLGENAGDNAFVAKTTDPVVAPQPYASPADFDAQYPQPLDPTEIIAMCEEVSLWNNLPELQTGLKNDMWRELNELAFTSGSAYISFADGECPEEYSHDGDNTTVALKNIGAKKSLSYSDIKHSMAVATGYGDGINRLVGATPASEGLPGGRDMGTFQQEVVADVKEKEIRIASTLVMNGWDRLLVEGNHGSNSLEFTGVENWQSAYSVTFHTNDNSASGSFSSTSFDRFLSESCVAPTAIWGHPQAVQEMMSSYFQLGFQGSQVVNFADGNRITPGFNFGSYVNTGRGRMKVVADNNFDRANAGGGAFQASLWAMRETHNGVPLVYKRSQFPLSLMDLVPGCTAVSFEVWAKTALVIKHACAHGQYTSQFTGRIVTTCATIG